MKLLATILEKCFRFNQRNDERRQEFCRRRSPIPLEQFLLDSAVGPENTAIALAVRDAIADLAGIDSQFIGAYDRFAIDLAGLPFWREPYGNLFIAALEDRGVSISHEEARSLTNIDVPPDNLSVRDFIHQIIEIKRRPASHLFKKIRTLK
jgi:hypothetical protein